MKKKIALLMAAVMLFGVTVGATIAWLTSTTGPVTNTFTVGDIKITLDESLVDNYGEKYLKIEEEATLDTDKDGILNPTELKDKTVTEVEGNPPTRVMENDYKLIPGHTYIKDPTVHVSDDSEDCFIFVKVEDGISEIEAEKTIEAQMLEKGWEKVDTVINVWYWTGDANATTITEKPVAVAAGTDVRVFDNFKLTDNANVAEYTDESIIITAYAIQVDGLTDETPATIWAKF